MRNGATLRQRYGHRSGPRLDLGKIRNDFPALRQKVHGRPLVYLDSAATTQLPRPVLDAVTRLAVEGMANPHRGVHHLSQRITNAYEGARATVARFLGAERDSEIVFTSGTTASINLVAWSYARPRLRPGDEILITGLEHHSNIVPWQLICEQTGAKLVVAPVTDEGEVPLEALAGRLSPRTRLVSIAHVSNALGTIMPVQQMVEVAHDRGAVVLVDGAQAAGHLPVDVRALGCDFYAFSGHKTYAMTGAGVLYGRAEILEAMMPYQGGGDMIRSVTFERTVYNDVPWRFEAGTPPISSVVALGVALDYLTAIGREAIAQHEHELTMVAVRGLLEVPGARLVGRARQRSGIVSFVMEGLHPHDVGTLLDLEGVAIRTGHHCAQPLMDRMGVPATARVSLGLYNNREDIERLLDALRRAREVLS